MARCSSVMSKFTIILINILTWVIAAGFIFLSIWLFREFGFYHDILDANHWSLLPSIILLVVGLVLFLLGLVGCIGAAKEHKCIIGLYFSLQLVTLVGLAAGAGLSYVYRQKIDNELHNVMMNGFKTYGQNGTLNKAIDDLQSRMHCCGVDNYTDWLTLPWHKTHVHEHYPLSCCKNQNCTVNGTEVYEQGCYTKIKEEFTGHNLAVYGVVGACAAVLLIGMVCTCLLHRDRRNRDFIYRDLGNDDGMHV